MKLRSEKQNRIENNPSQENDEDQQNTPQNGEHDLSLRSQPGQITPKANNENSQHYFDSLYKDLSQPGAYTNKLLRYLRKNETYSLHRPVRKIFPRRRIISRFPGQIVQSDLIDMQKYSTKNSNFNFILVVIDCFSKKLWTRPLKSKRGQDTADALRYILESMEYPIQTLIFDEGLEYKNQYVNGLLNEYNIHSYHILSKTKASTAERVNKTIKEKIWKYFTQTGKEKWINVLENIVSNYNETYHTTTKMAPNQVTWENRLKVFKTMFPKISNRVRCRLRVDDKVRIALNKDIFEKKYTQNWSKDIFTIKNVFQKNGVCWFRLKDSNNKIYSKGKYFYQLNKVS